VQQVEVNMYNGLQCSNPHPPEPSTPQELEYSLPMPHNDVSFSGDVSKLRVLDSGSQIIAIRKDFTQQVNVCIYLTHLLEMTGANSTINWTLRCAEFLGAQATNVSLKAQAHVIETMPSTSSLANLSKSKYH
jgi:hypothetical protein